MQAPEREDCRILVIDDNPAIHEDFTKILTRDDEVDPDLEAAEQALFGVVPRRSELPAHRLDSAFQGRDGLELVAKAVRQGSPYTVAFVDMRMPPGWDGLETIENLWREDADLQVVICTAYSDHAWSEIHERLGRRDQFLILNKPFDSVEIHQCVSSLAERQRLRRISNLKLEQLEQMVRERTRELETANAELRESDERFRQIAENLDDALWLTDRHEQRAVYVNPAYERIWGRPVADAGHLWAQGVHEEDARKVRGAMDREARGEPFEEIYRILRPDGSVRWIRSRGFPIRAAAGAITRMAGVSHDITGIKQAEAQLGERDKLEAIGRLAAGVAHELNTPLQFISDNTRFLRDAFADLTRGAGEFRAALAGADGSEDADRIAREVDWDYLTEEVPQALAQSLEGLERVTSIVRAMKDYSHPGGSRFVHVDLQRAIESTVTVSRNEWKYLADLETDLPPDLPPVPCLAGEINQVLLNLVINAAHAIEEARDTMGREKGRIEISARAADRHVEVRVADNGTGIPDHVKSRVFEQFFTTKPVGRGTGQGLAIARAVVVGKHGGTIEIESERGAGTTVVLRLPLDRPDGPPADVSLASSRGS